MKSYTYLLIDLACIAIPFLASFYYKHPFYKTWTSFFKANLIVAMLFIIWDYIFTEIGVWGFNPDYLTGFYIENLPVEEILFFIAIPYACVFSYFAFTYLINKNPLRKVQSTITYSLILILIVSALFNSTKLYTFITFLSMSLFLIYFAYKKTNLSLHYLNYLFILPFFFISNGILTGSFLMEPIVWYNDSENLGIRISTIPIEDSVYGMLLVFLNIELYAYFEKRNKKTIY